MLKKIAIFGPIALGVLVYLFALWNASRSLDWVDRFSSDSEAAMEAYDEWQWERPWARTTPRNCQSAEVLVGGGGAVQVDAELALERHALSSGETVSGRVGGSNKAHSAAQAAAECKYAGTEDRLTLDGKDGFDWDAHLDAVTRLAIHGIASGPDECLKAATLVTELAHDASVGGALGALSYATMELDIATALAERCGPEASDAALSKASDRLRRVEQQPPPFWRALHAESLLVELGSRNAAEDIEPLPKDPLAIKNAVFTGNVLETWNRAIQARNALPKTVEEQGVVAAAELWESAFEDRDDAYEHAIAPRPVEHIRAFAHARERLREARQELDIERASRSYRRLRSDSVLGAFERRYQPEAAED